MKRIAVIVFLVLFLCACNEKDEHIHEYEIIKYNPTCTSEGYSEYKCFCGNQYIDDIVEKIEHDYHDRICTYCNAINTNPSENLEFILNSDHLSYSLKGIGECEDSKVIVPSTYNNLPVTSICDNAFINNLNIKEIIIPKSINTIGKNILKGCSNLSALTSPYIYNGYIGYLFGAESSSYNNSFVPKSLKEVTITNEEKIFKNAFTNCSFLEKILIESNVTIIENNAFYNCIGLLEITIPSTIKEIGEKAFYNCENLLTVNFKGSYSIWFDVTLKSVYSNPMFYASYFNYYEDDIYKLLTDLIINDKVKNINDYQLYGFDSIIGIYISQSLEYIGNESLCGLTNLEKIEVDIENNNFSSEDGVLYSKDYIDLICYPCAKSNVSYNVNSNTININDYAFSENKYLEEIVINEKVKQIGKYAFSEMIKLKSIVIPEGVVSISEGLFFNSQYLQYIYLPNSLTEINTSAFEYCINLEQIFIPRNVLVIQAYAFRNCSKLSIYCEIDTKPSGWVTSYWNVYPSCPVYWNQER